MPTADLKLTYQDLEVMWGDVRPGDILPDGSEITQVHESQKLEAYRLTFQNGEKYDVSWDHIFKTDVENWNLTIPTEQALQIKLGLGEDGLPSLITEVADRDYVSEPGWMRVSDIVFYNILHGKYPGVVNDFGEPIQIESIRYIGLVECMCVTTNTGKYSLTESGVIHHNSVFLNSVIAHFVNSGGVELYLADPKMTEFKPFTDLPEVKKIALTLEEAASVFTDFQFEMKKRYKAMSTLGIRNIPLDGKVNIDGFVSVKGLTFREDEMVQIYESGSPTKQVLATDLPKLDSGDVLVEGDEAFGIEDTYIPISGNVQIGGVVEYKSLIFICDEYAELVENQPREKMRLVMRVQDAVESIARLGRAASIHLLIATQSSSTSLFPASLKNNIKFRNICGRVDVSISNMAIGTEEGNMIPRVRGMYLGNVDGESQLYQGYFAKESDVLESSKSYQGSKEKSSKGLSILEKIRGAIPKRKPKEKVERTKKSKRKPTNDELESSPIDDLEDIIKEQPVTDQKNASEEENPNDVEFEAPDLPSVERSKDISAFEAQLDAQFPGWRNDSDEIDPELAKALREEGANPEDFGTLADPQPQAANSNSAGHGSFKISLGGSQQHSEVEPHVVPIRVSLGGSSPVPNALNQQETPVVQNTQDKTQKPQPGGGFNIAE